MKSLKKQHVIAGISLAGIAAAGILIWTFSGGGPDEPIPAPTVPAAPSEVAATASDGQVTLRWSAVEGVDTYHVYWSKGRDVSQDRGTRIEVESGAEPAFTHADLTNGLTYHYLVTAVNAAGESAPSNPVSATPVPRLDPTVATSFDEGVAWLYSGENPLQTGVEPDAIDPQRLAVLRGRVLTRDSEPLAGVTVCLLRDGTFGETLTRADGMFDMAVNGGAQLTVCYEKEGYLPLQRSLSVPWRDYVWLPDVVMIAVDPQLTAVDLMSDAEVQVVEGSAVSDADGRRTGRLLVSRGTAAEMILPDGTRRPLESLSARITEYTVGENGPSAMPAELPPTSAYTYAFELSADEVLAEGVKVGGKDVMFSKPVHYYVENFLDFPVGTAVPVGYYDNDAAAWVPADNGRVIQVLAVTNGLADLDVNGAEQPASTEALETFGITEAERRELAARYQPGQSLWRVPLSHFSTWDCNWGAGLLGDETPPIGEPEHEGEPCDDECQASGSIISIQSQTLGETIPIVGTPLTLHYSSDRVPGRTANRTLHIPLTPPELPERLARVVLDVQIAGQRHTQTYDAHSDISESMTWDGKDGYGRIVHGTRPAHVRIGYVYPAVYQEPAQLTRSFAQFSGIPMEANRSREEITLFGQWTLSLSNWDARMRGLGGWTVNVHHVFDPVGGVLYTGDGRRRGGSSLTPVITMVAGASPGGDSDFGGYRGDGGPAAEALLRDPTALAVAPDGSLYIADTGNHCIRRVAPDGIIATVAGTGEAGFTGDGGPASEAQLHHPSGVALGPDGSLYVNDDSNHRVRRIDPRGTIATVAGGGTGGLGDGGLATEARLDPIGGPGGAGFARSRFLEQPKNLAIGPDGSLYVVDDNHRVRKIGTDGIISTVAGTGERGFSGDGGPATQAQLNNPAGLAWGPDGSLYIADWNNNRIRRVAPDGIITTVAGTGEAAHTGDGGPADLAALNGPVAVAVGPDNSLYVAEMDFWADDNDNHHVRRIFPDGTIITIAGISRRGNSGDGGPASQAQLHGPNSIALAPDGSLYISDTGNHRVRGISSTPGITGETLLIPSEDGGLVYEFDSSGRHLRTLHALTAATLLEFQYNEDGMLAAVGDGDGNVTTIERSGDGAPIAIRAPFGQRTRLELNSEGYLTGVTNPADEAVLLDYHEGGLLAGFTDPAGNTSRFSYDNLGRLIRNEDPAGGLTELARKRTANGYDVTTTTALDREHRYGVAALADGQELRVNTDAAGAQIESRRNPDGTRTVTYPDGTRVALALSPDPRWEMQAPVLTRLSVASPGGRELLIEISRIVTLADSSDPMTLLDHTEEVRINGRTYTYTYTRTLDERTNEVRIRSPEGREHVVTLDAQGRTRGWRMGNLEGRRYAFDEHGRRTLVERAGETLQYTYDERGRLTNILDAAGNQTLLAYDDAGRLISRTLPSGRAYQFAYDRNGNRIAVTMPNGAVHSLGYTQLGLPAGYTLPDGSRYSDEHDSDGQVEHARLPSGRTLHYRYDEGGRLTGLDYAEAAVAYAYDEVRPVCCGAEPPADVVWTPAEGRPQQIDYLYDGRFVTEAAFSGVANGRFRYRRDDDSFLTGITRDDGAEVELTYDDDGLLTGYGPFHISRDGATGLATHVTDGRFEIVLEYDGIGRVASRTHHVSGNQIYRLQLAYDDVGRIAERIETIGETEHRFTHEYDPDGQLVTVRRGDEVVERFDYDVNGNRVMHQVAEGPAQTARCDDMDRLVERAGVAYGFDADGFLISRGEDRFTYSARGELLEAALEGDDAITYTYDGYGRRVARADSTGTFEYLYGNPADAFEITAVRAPSGSESALFYDTAGRLFAIQQGETWYYVAVDQVGTPRVVCDAEGRAVKVLAYGSYGDLRSDSNPEFQLPIGFAAGLADPATGLVRFGFRDYDPAAGRWTSRDPLLFSSGQGNLYVYAGNDPVNLRDPTGLAIWVCNRHTGLFYGLPANHSYFWDDTTGLACGGFTGFQEESGPWVDCCREIPGSNGQELNFLACCMLWNQYQGDPSQWRPWWNDCHSMINTCIQASGLKNPGIPGGSLGKPCGSEGWQAPPLRLPPNLFEW